MDPLRLPILLIIGGAVLGGLLGARIFQWLRIPQVVGYIVIGVLVGKSGLHLIGESEIQGLLPFNYFALGIIGFLVGGELKLETFRKHARQYMAILLGEGVAAFILVGVLTGLMTYAVSHSVSAAIAAGVVLGAIASATDPASTIDVLWEYRSRGVLTSTAIAIIALDDALAMTLYGVGTAVAQLVTSQQTSVGSAMLKITVELLGAVALGYGLAMVFRFVVRWMRQPEQMLPLVLGLILLSVGVCVRFGMDIILAAMAMGFTLVNAAPYRSRWLFKTLRTFSVPIYVVFFVLIGARLAVGHMPGWLWGVIALYVVARSVGKMAGSYFGARLSGGAPAVRKYLGLTLFAQGGVAVGLAIMASSHLQSIIVSEAGLTLGDMIIFCVTVTTLAVQLIGPFAVKLAIIRSGERGMNVTEDDLLQSYTVGEVMDTTVPAFPAEARVADVFRQIADSEAMTFSVVDTRGDIRGIVTMNELKQCLADPGMAAWVVAFDIMLPTPDVLLPTTPLADALHHMRETGLEYLPVVDEPHSRKYVGMIEMQAVQRKITQEVLRRRSLADHGPCTQDGSVGGRDDAASGSDVRKCEELSQEAW